ncbi:MAG: Stp1/IreP family PP2C-type Ser/Thr phosphatase [Deltaproteobacteria bacterium]|nr:Stp1/IreP family PP2C-type Ser/Thr phosphatase [Deltaproteobacteria bacterium]
MAELRLKAAGFSHVGMKRKQNQDNFVLVPEHRLFVVADGMGGHKGGETASHLAVTTIANYFKTSGANPQNAKMPAAERLQRAMRAANQAIQDRGKIDATLQGMGTTTVAMHFTSEKLFVGHVGDSRCYMMHPHRIWQLTRDHSLVQEKLRAGLITRAQLKTDRMKNVITRSVGFESEVDIDIYQLEPHPGDVFVVCSDGLSGMVDDHQIRDIVDEHIFQKDSLEGAVKKLIETANANGGDDNVTAVVVKVV